jgi:hypothetical protein
MESALNDAADVEERLKLLARVLLDIAIHPFTSNFRDCPELWEAQYIWLHLFYRTGKERYGEQAKQCDAFRHAEVVKLNKASKTLEKEGQ